MFHVLDTQCLVPGAKAAASDEPGYGERRPKLCWKRHPSATTDDCSIASCWRQLPVTQREGSPCSGRCTRAPGQLAVLTTEQLCWSVKG